MAGAGGAGGVSGLYALQCAASCLGSTLFYRPHNIARYIGCRAPRRPPILDPEKKSTLPVHAPFCTIVPRAAPQREILNQRYLDHPLIIQYIRAELTVSPPLQLPSSLWWS